MPPSKPEKLTITVAGAEGDTAVLELNAHQHIHQLLRTALKGLYGEPIPDPNQYDVVIGGNIAALELTLTEAGLSDGDEVAVLPKEVSRG